MKNLMLKILNLAILTIGFLIGLTRDNIAVGLVISGITFAIYLTIYFVSGGYGKIKKSN